jgi:DNA-binding MarR family transcriptional regulator
MCETDGQERTPPARQAEPVWLTPQERESWMAFAGMLLRLPAALDAQLQRDSGISHFEYLVLATLSEATDRTLRMSDLAFIVNGSLSRLSHVVTRLERRGWVRREPCRTDGRYTNAILTPEGLEKILSAAPGHVETVRHLVVDALTEAQLRQLGQAGRKVLQRIDPDSPLP